MGTRRGTVRRSMFVATVLAAALGSMLVPAVEAAPADEIPETMVALGDSFAAGPLVPVQLEQPWGCLRSSLNYAHQVAQTLQIDLTDVTCSGADTDDMWETHGVSPDEEFAEYLAPLGYTGHPGNPPQLDALRPDTDLVTLQIGGNDIGFGSIATACIEAVLAGVSCRPAVEAEQPFDRIAETASAIAAVLDETHRRSPEARILVLGYPGIFAFGPVASCPAMGVDERDARFLRTIQVALNTMIRDVAEAPDASYSEATSYVDVYRPSRGHTACDLPAIRWVEPFVPVNAAAPVHPNLGGMIAIRDLLLAQLPGNPDLPL